MRAAELPATPAFALTSQFAMVAIEQVTHRYNILSHQLSISMQQNSNGAHSLATSVAISAAFPSDDDEASRAVSAPRPGVMTALDAPARAASAWAWSGPRQTCSYRADTLSLRAQLHCAQQPVMSRSGTLKKHAHPALRCKCCAALAAFVQDVIRVEHEF